MKPLKDRRRAIVSGKHRSVDFTIDRSEVPAIMGYLSDKMYNNPVRAVIREYSCNAWDAHVAAGKADVPIRVDLPTNLMPELAIRDFGPGLPFEDIKDTYVKIGKSTKTETNEELGMFGLGAKAGYAYVTSFTIISYHGGLKSTYVAYIGDKARRSCDEIEVACHAKYLMRWLGIDPDAWEGEEDPTEYVDLLQYLWKEEDDDELNYERIEVFRKWLAGRLDDDAETGMEIRVPVQTRDIPMFYSEAVRIYQHFDPLPDISGLPSSHFLRKAESVGTYVEEAKVRLLRPTDPLPMEASWEVVMKNVAYPLTDRLIEEVIEGSWKAEEKKQVLRFFKTTRGLIYADIGELAPHPSREGLVLNRPCKENLSRRIKDALLAAEKAVEQKVKKIQKEDLPSADKIQAIRKTYQSHNLRIPAKAGALPLHGSVTLLNEELDTELTGMISPRSERRTFRLKEINYRYSRSRGAWKVKAKNADRIPVAPQKPNFFLLRNTDKPYSRVSYGLSQNFRNLSYRHIFLVEPRYPYTPVNWEAFDAFLKKHHLDGMGNKALLSTFPAPPSTVRVFSEEEAAEESKPAISKTEAKKKMYGGEVFEWTGNAEREGAGRRLSWCRTTKGSLRESDNWALRGRDQDIPEGSLFFVLDRFVPSYVPDYRLYQQSPSEALKKDLKLLRDAGVEVPLIVGVKSAHHAKKGQPEGTVDGSEWVKKKIKEVARSSKIAKRIRNALRWFPTNTHEASYSTEAALFREVSKRVEEGTCPLPKGHSFVKFARGLARADKELEKLRKEHPVLYTRVADTYTVGHLERKHKQTRKGRRLSQEQRSQLRREQTIIARWDALVEVYPWIGSGKVLDVRRVFASRRTHASLILEYISLIDNQKEDQ